VSGHDTRQPKRSRLTAWLQLLRLPTLLTVPGDPAAGFCLAMASGREADNPWLRLPLAVGVSLLMYCAGLLCNDWFDLTEDRRDRPDRPLPAGEMKPRTVVLAAVMVILMGLIVSFVAGRTTGYVALALAGTILAYDGCLKRLPVAGPLSMGACRGLSLLVGSAAFGPSALISPLVIVSAAGLTVYIAAVTHIARCETQRQRVARLLPTAALVGWYIAWITVLKRTGDSLTGMVAGVYTYHWGLAAAILLLGLVTAMPLRGRPKPALVQLAVGGHLRLLLLIQASLVAMVEWSGRLLALPLAAMFIVSVLLSRRFYSS